MYEVCSPISSGKRTGKPSRSVDGHLDGEGTEKDGQGRENANRSELKTSKERRIEREVEMWPEETGSLRPCPQFYEEASPPQKHYRARRTGRWKSARLAPRPTTG